MIVVFRGRDSIAITINNYITDLEQVEYIPQHHKKALFICIFTVIWLIWGYYYFNNKEDEV
jgi:hypothetical protein